MTPQEIVIDAMLEGMRVGILNYKIERFRTGDLIINFQNGLVMGDVRLP